MDRRKLGHAREEAQPGACGSGPTGDATKVKKMLDDPLR